MLELSFARNHALCSRQFGKLIYVQADKPVRGASILQRLSKPGYFGVC